MTYSPLIPSPASSPQNSASPIQINFSQFASIFSNLNSGIYYNHYPLNDNQQGKHGAVIFDQLSADPIVNLTLCSLYAKSTPAGSPPSNQPQLFARIQNFLPNGQPNTPMQLTFNTVSNTTPYQTFFIGGYILYFGVIPAPAMLPTQTITLSPVPTALLNVQASSTTIDAVTILPISVSSFRVVITNSQTTYWLAIGKQ